MAVPLNINQFKKWAQENKGIRLFLHYDQRKAVRDQVTLVEANQSSVWFLDEGGKTFKIEYPRKGHYRFTRDFFSFKTMIFKYRLPGDGKMAVPVPDIITAHKPGKTAPKSAAPASISILNEIVDNGLGVPVRSDVKFDVDDQDTVTEIVQALWEIALKSGYDRNGKVLIMPDHAAEFIKQAPCIHEHLLFLGSRRDSQYESIQELYPRVTVRDTEFEDLFLRGMESIGAGLPVFKDGPLSLIIGMPLIGDLINREKLTKDIAWTEATTLSEYYVRRGLDLLRPGGLLVYLLRANPEDGQVLFLQSGYNACKATITRNSNLLDAYQFTFVWAGQELNSEILILQKRMTQAI